MFKTVGLLKRKPGMTTEEFRKYYESQHRLIGEKYLKGRATKYMRRFISPFPNPLTGEVVYPEYDVILEIWYSSKSDFEETGKIAEISNCPVVISGGVSSIDDIKKAKELNNKNIEGIIVGKAIYDGDIKLDELAKEVDA